MLTISIARLSAVHWLMLFVAVYTLFLGILLAILVAAALALPPAPAAACNASGRCHKYESPAAMRGSR